MCKKILPVSSLHCIIPPYIRRKLMETYEDKATSFKHQVESFAMDEALRGQRTTFSRLGKKEKMVLAKECFRKTAQAKPLREVYSAQNDETLPGVLIRKEGEERVKDKDVNRAYDAAGHTWDFYFSLFGRNSMDNAGMKIIQTVHYGKKYENAFWDGKQMVYGDGDGKIFASFTSDIDVIGHELTHGVQQFETNLDYSDQSGALNESLADIFGIMIKQKVLNQTVKTSDWLIGENILIGEKYAIRSLKAPGTAYKDHPVLGNDPQPAHMSGYTNDPLDNGGVHLNSGIPSHAFYLAATEVGGYAWEKTGMVWYSAMTNKELVSSDATFGIFREATIAESINLFGEENNVTLAIRRAWNEVGV